MRSGALQGLVFALTAASPALAQTAPWAEATIELGAQATFASDYSNTLAIFDHRPLGVAIQGAGRFLRAPTSWVRVGARAGYLHASSSATADAPGGSTGAISVDLADLGAVVRFVPSRATSFRFDCELSAGLFLGSVGYRGVGQLAVGPRLGASIFLGYAARPKGLIVGARLGLVYAPWDGAGGSAWDPAFSGITLGLEAGASR